MRKIVSFAVLVVCLFSCIRISCAENEIMIYVSVSGDDSNAGSFEKPLKTLQAAKKKAETIAEPANIVIRGGNYYLTSALEFTAADANINFSAYNGEKVVISNGIKLNAQHFKRLSDQYAKERLDIDVQNKIFQISLNDEGITDYGSIVPYGRHASDSASPRQLIADGETMSLAEWPNKGYAELNNVTSNGSDYSYGYNFSVDSNRVNKWEWKNDIYVYGEFYYEWSDDMRVLSAMNKSTNAMTVRNTDVYGMRDNGKVRFINVLEELDSPGEWYLNQNTGMLYVYLRKDISSSDIIFSTKDFPLIKMTDSKNITFDHIEFSDTRGTGVVMSRTDSISFFNSTFRNIGRYGIDINNCENTKITGGYFTQLGKGGVNITGGDTVNLIPSNNVVENCHFENYGIYTQKYSFAVRLYGVGDKVTHCRINNAPHFAIYFLGNNNIIEYNDIYDVIKSSTDAAAIYAGRSWVNGGTTIRYNYIHDCGLIESDGKNGIYLDDWMTDVSVYGNVFYKVNAAVAMHTSQYCNVKNNIMLGCHRGIVLNSKNYSSAATIEKNNVLAYDMYKAGNLRTNYSELTFCSSSMFENYFSIYDPTNTAWNRNYPYLATFFSDGKLYNPKYDTISNNVYYKQDAEFQIKRETADMTEIVYTCNDSAYYISDAQYNCTLTNNFKSDGTASLVDAASGNVNIEDYSEIETNVPDFEKLDITRCGIEGETAAIKGSFSKCYPADNARDIEVDDLYLVYDNTSGADTYTVEVATDADFTDIVLQKTVNTNSVPFENAQRGTKYYWRVKEMYSSRLYSGETSNANEESPFCFTTEYVSEEAGVYLTNFNFRNGSGKYVFDMSDGEFILADIGVRNASESSRKISVIAESLDEKNAVYDKSQVNDEIEAKGDLALGIGLRVGASGTIIVMIEENDGMIAKYELQSRDPAEQMITDRRVVLKSITLKNGITGTEKITSGINKISAIIRSFDNETMSSEAILAIYNNKGVMIGSNLLDTNINAYRDNSVGFSFEGDDAAFVKVFLFDSNQSPYIDSVEYYK